MASPDAVKATDATRVINGMLFAVDACSFTIPCTKAATMAYGVAISSAVAIGKNAENDDSDQRYSESHIAFQPYIHRVERIAVMSLSSGRKHIVAPLPQRSEQRLRDASVGTVRSQ